jgi:hypothetical protein
MSEESSKKPHAASRTEDEIPLSSSKKKMEKQKDNTSG